jgi:hypothetical protein
MTGGEVDVIVSWVAASAGIAIVVVGWMREHLWPLERNRERAPQRKADESQARVNCGPRPRLGIDVAPIRRPAGVASGVHHHRPLVDEHLERVIDVIHDHGADAA